ncbi:hypothetical protein VTH06DRAFT_6318 [Thermothelomyces fergusii]
MPKRGV